MQTKYPGVVEHVLPSRTGRFTSKPLPEMTWHHRDSYDSLKLVDRKDHNKYHKIYHPNSSGGRKKWGGGKICRK